MNRLQLRNTAHVGSTTIVSVLSGKGGVGKTLVTFNLAHVLAADGYKVLLVDADFSSGNLHIFGNVRCEYGVRQYLNNDLSLLEATSHVTDNIDLLGASLRGSMIDELEVTPSAQLISRLRDEASHYDFILLDHASGVTKPATVLAHGSDVNLLVVIPELTSIADAYGLYKFLIETNHSLDCRLLVNRCQADDEAGYIREKFTALAGRFLATAPNFIGQVSESSLARKALAGQCPLVQLETDGLVSQQLSQIARRLIAVSSAVVSPAATSSHRDDKITTAAADIKE